MGLINNKFTYTFTDDDSTDPVITETVNFTDDSGDNYTSTRHKIEAGEAETWQEEPLASEVSLFDLSTLSTPQRAKYIVIQTTSPIYVWFGKHPDRDGSDDIDTTASPEVRIDKLMVLAGPTTTGATMKMYAINPSRAEDSNLTATVNVMFVYE